MATCKILIAAAALMLTAAAAHATPVSFGNLTVYNNPLTVINFNGPSGGPYTKFVFSTNWSFGSGGALSNEAAWFIANPNNNANLVAGFSSVTGAAANGNPTTITITGTLSVGVTSSTALQFVAGQNAFSSFGAFATSGFWSNTTINFYVPKPPPPTPTGIVNMGDINPNSGLFVSIDTTGSDFDPAVAVFGADGLLLGTNDSSTGVPGAGTALDAMTLRPGDYFVFVAGQGATFAPEDLDVSVPPGAPGGTLAGGINAVAWPVSTITPGEGQWFAITVTAPPCPGDVDGDDDTDVFDFAIFAANFGHAPVTPFTGGDLDGNGSVDVFDFAIFAANFGCTGLP